MRRCPAPEELDGYAFEEFGPVRAAQLALHVSDCERCARELAWLRAERGALEARAEQRPSSAPAIYRNLERRLPPAPSPRGLSVRWGSLGLAAAYLAILLLALPLRTGLHASSGRSAARPPPSATSSLEPLVCMAPGRDGVEQIESEFSACLIATPVPGGCVDICL